MSNTHGIVERTILLVEDDPDDILLIGRALSQAQLESAVSVVRDGEEAVRFLEAQSEKPVTALPSLILLDLKLPKMSGLEVLQWVRKHPKVKSLPVVVLTSSKYESDLERAYALGANSYITKPVDYQSLLDLVKALKLYWLDLNRPPGKGLQRP